MKMKSYMHTYNLNNEKKIVNMKKITPKIFINQLIQIKNDRKFTESYNFFNIMYNHRQYEKVFFLTFIKQNYTRICLIIIASWFIS